MEAINTKESTQETFIFMNHHLHLSGPCMLSDSGSSDVKIFADAVGTLDDKAHQCVSKVDHHLSIDNLQPSHHCLPLRKRLKLSYSLFKRQQKRGLVKLFETFKSENRLFDLLASPLLILKEDYTFPIVHHHQILHFSMKFTSALNTYSQAKIIGTQWNAASAKEAGFPLMSPEFQPNESFFKYAQHFKKSHRKYGVTFVNKTQENHSLENKRQYPTVANFGPSTANKTLKSEENDTLMNRPTTESDLFENMLNHKVPFQIMSVTSQFSSPTTLDEKKSHSIKQPYLFTEKSLAKISASSKIVFPETSPTSIFSKHFCKFPLDHPESFLDDSVSISSLIPVNKLSSKCNSEETTIMFEQFEHTEKHISELDVSTHQNCVASLKNFSYIQNMKDAFVVCRESEDTDEAKYTHPNSLSASNTLSVSEVKPVDNSLQPPVRGDDEQQVPDNSVLQENKTADVSMYEESNNDLHNKKLVTNNLFVKSAFKFTALPQENPNTSILNSDSDAGPDALKSVLPLATCNRPRRVGLSKKQHVQHLHKKSFYGFC
ncbi:uncharacterized protein LOC131940557 isoform X2 [Physella acuta]|uniref:uncharacterized protein LOC131940557 isoform X2 n=1 Tax=Physella acuta TaxID=109671 RepID=UPI0027DB5CDC|nr:uncharacterized protein LOC131940557 isoform X2 [Physella acuta]